MSIVSMIAAAVGVGAYQANSVVFAGATVLARGAAYTGAADSTSFTFACRIKLTGTGADQHILSCNQSSGSNPSLVIGRNANNTLYVLGFNTSTINLNATSNTALTAGTWYAVLISVSGTIVRIYIDDAANLAGSPTNNNVARDFTNTQNTVGANAANTANNRFVGELADPWFDIGRFVEVSTLSNRRLFFDAANLPVSKGANGSVPFGAAPTLFLSGATASWQTNKGAGGGMTLTGILGPVTYYVANAPAGSDSNPGTQASPWATITKVNAAVLKPGDSILFNGGQTFSGSLNFTTTNWTPADTAGNPITIGSYGTGRATISSGAARGILTTNLAGFTLRDLNFVGSGAGDVDGVFLWNGLAGSGKLAYIRVTNLDITGYRRSGFFAFGGYGPTSSGTDTAGFNDVIIDNVISHGNCLAGATDVANAGIRVAGFYGFNADQTHPTHTNVTIRNCVSHTNTGRAGGTSWTGGGIVMNGVKPGLIERCVSHDNGANSNTSAGPVGIFVFDVDSITIQYNESYDNKTAGGDGGGFDIDGGCTNCVMQYNYSHGNMGPGFMVYSYAETGKIVQHNNNVVRYNISQNDNTTLVNGSIFIGTDGSVAITNAEVYNNTVYTNAANGVCLMVGHPQAGSTTGHVANNIFYSSAGAWLMDAGTLNPTGLIFRGNDYFAAGTFRIRQNNTTYSTLAAWRLSPNRELNVSTNYGLSSDPLLSGAGSGGTLGGYIPNSLPQYRLTSGSTIGEAGLNLLTMFSLNPGSVDFYGTVVPVGSSYGIGASETVELAVPLAVDDTFESIAFNSGLQFLDVLANDTYAGIPSIAIISQNPSDLGATISSGQVGISLPTGTAGAKSITYRLTATGNSGSSDAVATAFVGQDAPVAQNDTGLEVLEGETISVAVGSNDLNIDGATYAKVGSPSGPAGITTAFSGELLVVDATAVALSGAAVSWSQQYSVTTGGGTSTATASGLVQPSSPSVATIAAQWELAADVVDSIGGVVGSTSGGVQFGQPTIPIGGTGGVAFAGTGYGVIADEPIFDRVAWGITIYGQATSMPASDATNRQIVNKDATGHPDGWTIEQWNVGGVSKLNAYIRDDAGSATNGRLAATTVGAANLPAGTAFMATLTLDPAAASRIKLFLRKAGEGANTQVAAITGTSTHTGMLSNTTNLYLGIFNAVSNQFSGALQRLILWNGAPTIAQLNALAAPQTITVSLPTVAAPVAADFTGRDIASGETTEIIDPTVSPSQNADTATVSIVSTTGPIGTTPPSVGANGKTITITRNATSSSGAYSVTYRLTNSAGTDDGVISGTIAAAGAFTALASPGFITNHRPTINHNGGTSETDVRAKPPYSPTDPLSASKVDPMSGNAHTRIIRLGGDNGATVFINGTQNSNLKFPLCLQVQNLGEIQQGFNADGTLFMVSFARGRTGDATPACRSYIIDVTGAYTNGPWRIIRASGSSGLGDGLPNGDYWAWDPGNPQRAYAFADNGSVYEWWPVGATGHAVGQLTQIWGGISGFKGFATATRGRCHTSFDGTYCCLGGQRISDNALGGIRRNLKTGAISSFVPVPTPNNGDVTDRPAHGVTNSGALSYFSYEGGGTNGPTSADYDEEHYFRWSDGAFVSNVPSTSGHHDGLDTDGRDRYSAQRNGEFVLIDCLGGSTIAKTSGWTNGNDHHVCRSRWRNSANADRFETFGGTGSGSTNGCRYAFVTDYSNAVASIVAIRLGASDMSVYRYVGCHRMEKGSGDNASESHPQSSHDGRMVAVGSNWRMPNAANGLIADVKAYVWLLPDAWWSSNNSGL